MSSLMRTNFCNTIILLDSTRNAPKQPYATTKCHIYADEVYAMSEDSSDDRQHKKAKKSVPTNLTPVTIMVVDTISGVRSRKLLKVLLDSGSTTTLINKKCLPKNCKLCPISSSRKVYTLSVTYTSTEVVTMRNLRLPVFDKKRNVDQQKALVFQSETCKYDVILGADFLTKTGIDVKYSTGTMEWFNSELQLRNSHLLEVKDFQAMAEMIEVKQEEEFFGMDWYNPTCYAVEILDAKYEKVEIDVVINQFNHLDPQQKEDLKKVLQGHTKLFDGTLGVYPDGNSTLTYYKEL